MPQNKILQIVTSIQRRTEHRTWSPTVCMMQTCILSISSDQPFMSDITQLTISMKINILLHHAVSRSYIFESSCRAFPMNSKAQAHRFFPLQYPIRPLNGDYLLPRNFHLLNKGRHHIIHYHTFTTTCTNKLPYLPCFRFVSSQQTNRKTL